MVLASEEEQEDRRAREEHTGIEQQPTAETGNREREAEEGPGGKTPEQERK